MRILIDQHAPFEGPSPLVPALQSLGQSVLLHNAGTAPFPAQVVFEGLIVPGAPGSVHDIDKYLWLTDELELLVATIWCDL